MDLYQDCLFMPLLKKKTICRRTAISFFFLILQNNNISVGLRFLNFILKLHKCCRPYIVPTFKENCLTIQPQQNETFNIKGKRVMSGPFLSCLN